jgi:hypothetical protein
MAGVITDRLIPSKTDMFPDPPIAPELIEGLNDDGNLEVHLMERISEDAADYVVLFINESTLGRSLQLEITITGKFVMNAIIDTGSKVNLISGEIFEKLVKAGVQIPVLPVENVVLVAAFGKRSKRIRQQALLDFTMENDRFEIVCMVSSQLKKRSNYWLSILTGVWNLHQFQ